MPRYFFDVNATGQTVVDHVGEDLSGPDEALDIAMELLHCVEWAPQSMILDTAVRGPDGKAIIKATLHKSYRRFDQTSPEAGAQNHTPAVQSPSLRASLGASLRPDPRASLSASPERSSNRPNITITLCQDAAERLEANRQTTADITSALASSKQLLLDLRRLVDQVDDTSVLHETACPVRSLNDPVSTNRSAAPMPRETAPL